MSDPGGFPGTSGGDDGDGEPPDRPQHARNVDPWGEHGPATREAANRPLTPRERVELLRFPTFGDPTIEAVEFADTYARLAATTAAKLAFVDELIAMEFRGDHIPGQGDPDRAEGGRGGIGAIVGYEYSAQVTGPAADQTVEAVATSERLRALIDYERQLSRDLERILANGIKLAVKAKQADLIRRYGEWIAVTLENFSDELGVDWEDEGTRRAAQRSVLRTREKLGVGASNADAAGPRLSGAERARIGLAPPTVIDQDG